MELLDSLYLTEVLHTISSVLLIPVVLLLLLLILYAIYSAGSVLVEVFAERRHYRAFVPQIMAQIQDADFADLPRVIDESGLLRSQKDDLEELVNYLYMPEDSRTEVAKRLIANQEMAYDRQLGYTDVVAKTAPMLGLMGTLIPLGPGIVALGTGDVSTLSSALLVAFDTTVAGLAAAVVCFVISRVRRRWYNDYLVSMESVMNSLLEKGRVLHEEGFAFPHDVYKYDSNGRKAQRVSSVGQAAARVGEGD